MSEKRKNWDEANQHYLTASLKVVKDELEQYGNRLNGNQINKSEDTVSPQLLNEAATAGRFQGVAAIDSLVSMLGLSTFERKILLMCAGVELDAGFSKLIATLQGDSLRIYPSFSLALAAFSDAHWSAVSPVSPLRYWRLIEMQNGDRIIRSPLKIDENILNYIAGVSYMDEGLESMVTNVYVETSLVSSQRELAENILLACSSQSDHSTLAVIHLSGESRQDMISVAAHVSAAMSLRLYKFSLLSLPGAMKEITDLARLWNREAALNSYALFIDSTSMDLNDKSRVQCLNGFIENIQGVLFLSNDEWLPECKRTHIKFTVNKPVEEEQLQLWKQSLGARDDRLDGPLKKIVSHFNFSAKTIGLASTEITATQAATETAPKNPDAFAKAIWNACCIQTRPQVDRLAQRINPVAGWNDLVLPEAQKQILKEISMQVKHRRKVYQEWGFSSIGSRGLGISALFSGESGTGKTMASEVLANELQLDLYRIDLSQVVNKYIGETEKNLKQIFDAAEEGGAILLFDEADALFGKRSDVKDSHDRYSNIEVSYLLQRMEAYGGLAILTTNMKNAIDKAFLRRIRFVVQFPYPDAVHRAEIWRRIFPSNTPVKDLDMEKLARMSVPGGNIRNIAINAAFLAADENQPVQMRHVSRAARSEYAKLEKPFSNTETAGW